MNELKACPWGHVPQLTKTGDHVGYGLFADSYFISCQQCEREKRVIYVASRTQPIKIEQLVTSVGYVFADTLEEVIKLWNTRPIEDALRAERDAALVEIARLTNERDIHKRSAEMYLTDRNVAREEVAALKAENERLRDGIKKAKEVIGRSSLDFLIDESPKNYNFGDSFEVCPRCGNRTMLSRDKECRLLHCGYKGGDA